MFVRKRRDVIDNARGKVVVRERRDIIHNTRG